MFALGEPDSTVIIRRDEGVNAICISQPAGTSPDEWRLAVADEGGSLRMYRLELFFARRGMEYEPQNEQEALIWEEAVAEGFGWGHGHQRRKHSCSCDGCSSEQGRLAAQVPDLAKLYDVFDQTMKINKPEKGYEPSVEHACTCAACDEVISKIDARIEMLKGQAAKEGLDTNKFKRIAPKNVNTKRRLAGAAQGVLSTRALSSSLLTSTADKLTEDRGRSATVGHTGGNGDEKHQCGCEACAETLRQFHRDIDVLRSLKKLPPEFERVLLQAAVCFMRFSPDGIFLAVVNKERCKIELRDAATSQLLKVLPTEVVDSGDGWSISPLAAFSFSQNSLAVAGGLADIDYAVVFSIPESDMPLTKQRRLAQEASREVQAATQKLVKAKQSVKKNRTTATETAEKGRQLHLVFGILTALTTLLLH